MESIGIIATLFVVLAFAMTGEIRIRVLDAVGAALFIVYGITIHSFSTILLNAILVCIHIYKLIKMNRKGNVWN